MGGSPRPNQTREVQNPGQLDGIEFQTRSDDEVAGGDLASIFSSTVGWGGACPAEQGAVGHQLELVDRWDHGFAAEEFDEDREAARADAVDEEESRDIARGRTSRAGRRARNVGGLEEYRMVLDGSDEGNEPAYVDVRTAYIPMDPTPARDDQRDLNEDSDRRPLWVREEESEPILQGLNDVLRNPGRTLGTRPSKAPPRIFDVPNVPPFPNITFNRVPGRPEVQGNEAGDPEVVRRASERFAKIMPMSAAGLLGSPLGQEIHDVEPLRSSNEFTPQWGESSRERSASAKRPSPVGAAEERSKARRASPRPPGTSAGDADMPDAADIPILSTPESRRSEGASHSGVSRRRGESPFRRSRTSDRSPPRISHARGSGGEVPERVEISTPPAVRSRSSRESEPGRDDLHADLQLIAERGEASGPVVAMLIAFADQIRSLEQQMDLMHESWHEKHNHIMNRVERLANDVGSLTDAGRMRTVVQQFAGEMIPDTRMIVRAAINEQSVIIDERINSLAAELQNSVRSLENNTRITKELIHDNHVLIHRGQVAFEDRTRIEIEKVERRIASVEAQSVSSFVRASGDGSQITLADVSDRLDTVAHEGENFGVWAGAKINEIEEEIKNLTSRVEDGDESRGRLASEVRYLRSGIPTIGTGLADQAATPTQAVAAPRNWQEMFNSLYRKVEELASRVRAEVRRSAQNQEHQATMDSRLNALTASTEGIGSGLRALRVQVRNAVTSGAPVAGTDHIQSVVRRELVHYREQVDACNRRLVTVRQNIQVLTDISNTTQERIAGVEAVLEQTVEDTVARGQRATAPGPGFVAFVGQPHRVRSPTPNPSDRGGSRGNAAGGQPRSVSPISNRSRGTATQSMSAGIRDDSRTGRRPISPGRDDSIRRGYGHGREDERTRDRSFSPPRPTETQAESRRARETPGRGAGRDPQVTTNARARDSEAKSN